MADQTLEILIKTLSDTVGVEKVQQALNAAKGGADKSAEAHTKAGKEVERHTEKFQALRKVASAVGQEVPAFGAAMQFAFGAAAGSAAVLIMGVHALSGAIQKVRDRYREAADIEAAVWRGSIEGSNAAKDSAEEYATAVAKIGREVARAKDKEAEELAILQAMGEARQKILDAQYKSEVVTAGDSEEKKAEIERRYAKKKSAEELKAQEDTLRVREGELQRRQLDADAARKEADEAAAAKEAGDPAGRARAEAAKQWLKEHSGDVEKASFWKKVSGDPAELRKYADDLRKDTMADPQEKLVAESLAQRAENAQKKWLEAKAREEEERGFVKVYEDAEKKRDQRYTEALERRRETETRLAQQKSETETSRKVLDINRKTASEVNATEAKGDLLRAGYYPSSKLGQTLHGNIEAQEARANGERMTQEQAKSMQQLVAALKAAGNNQKQITQIVTMMMDLTRSHEEKIKELFARLKQQKAQSRRSGLNAGG